MPGSPKPPTPPLLPPMLRSLGRRDAQLPLANGDGDGDGDGTSCLTADPKHIAPGRNSVRAAKQAYGEALRHSSCARRTATAITLPGHTTASILAVCTRGHAAHRQRSHRHRSLTGCHDPPRPGPEREEKRVESAAPLADFSEFTVRRAARQDRKPSDRPQGRDSGQIEMQPQSVVERGKRSRRELPDRVTVETTHRNRTNLLRLSLRLTRHTRFVRFDENLKREHMCRVTRQRHHGDHPPTESLRRRIGAIITHHNGGSTLGRFTPLRRIKINPVHMTPADHSPSAEVTSQSSSTPPSTKAAA